MSSELTNELLIKSINYRKKTFESIFFANRWSPVSAVAVNVLKEAGQQSYLLNLIVLNYDRQPICRIGKTYLRISLWYNPAVDLLVILLALLSRVLFRRLVNVFLFHYPNTLLPILT